MRSVKFLLNDSQLLQLISSQNFSSHHQSLSSVKILCRLTFTVKCPTCLFILLLLTFHKSFLLRHIPQEFLLSSTHSLCCPQHSPPSHSTGVSSFFYSFSMLSTAFSSGTSPICGVMSGVVTQKLKESRRGNTVSTGSRSNMVTISFLPRLACLMPEHSL